MKKAAKTFNLEKFAPALLLLIVVLSFAVGYLFQKVSALEENIGKAPVTAGNTAPQKPSAQQQKLADLDSVARAAGVDVSKFNSCVSEGNTEARVNSDYEGGTTAGVSGTPGNFVMNGKGEVWQLGGAVPYTELKKVIDVSLGTSTAAVTGKLDASQASLLPKITAQDHVRGNRNAQIFLIEYSDFECPYCKSFHPTAMQALEEYGDKIGWAYRHYPLDMIHPNARPAAIASECVAELGGDEAFWKFADEIFTD